MLTIYALGADTPREDEAMSRARVEQLTTQPWDTRVQFRTDRSGRPFSYRPNQLVTVREAIDLIADRIPTAPKRGRAVEDVLPTSEPAVESA